MRVVKLKAWEQFRAISLDYAGESRQRRRQLLFRGHSRATWDLATTLDRNRAFRDDLHREEVYGKLLEESLFEAIGIVPNPADLPDGAALEFLARHHGIPSPILDWSESPYVAAFFAFDGSKVASRNAVAIWAFDLARFDPDPDVVTIYQARELLRSNRRALQQRGIFTRINTIRAPLIALAESALTKFVLPAHARGLALSDLDAMTIDAATLFADLDGAARTALNRLEP